MESIQINDPDCSMSEPECQIACTLTAQRDYEAMTVALAAADIDTDVVKIIHGSDGADDLVQIYVPHPRLGGEVLQCLDAVAAIRIVLGVVGDHESRQAVDGASEKNRVGESSEDRLIASVSSRSETSVGPST